ncbi:phage tail tape measure protein [Bacillus cereus group sp. MYBK69-1]|uniref:phage tail tape measure protein n=1 Tax=unclassified Bacillus cereus group TaxID=2750818 RepID=UPI003F79A92C
MAGRIKGITIEIGGETTGLQNALKDVNKRSNDLTKELKDVERLLKFDPGNVEALAQKQQLLTKQIENTTQKLDKLKVAEQQVQAQFQNGKISEEQYRAFRREIEFTEGSLNGLKNKLGNMKAEQDNVASSTRQLETLFSATGKSVDDFAGALGNRLVNAIRSGTATSKQLEQAIGIIGREALGAGTDIDKLQRALRSVDAGNSIQQVRNELRDLQQEAGKTEKKFEGLKIGLENVIGGLAAGGGISTAIEKALDVSKLQTKIDISFDVPESSKKSVEDAVRGVQAYGLDMEESLEGVRRQWALNKGVSDEANAAVVKGAATIAQAYSGIDFTELIQEVNEIGNELGITQEGALTLTNALLKVGFPPEQLDIIAEYGGQLTRAGYNAEEVQAIMEAGVETGTWNIDNLLDGLKEGRIKAAEFGQGVDKAMKEALEGTNISAEQLEKWGQAVANGGREGSEAMTQIAQALSEVEDETKRNELGVKLFGTMYEDQGQNIINTLLGAKEKTIDFKKNQDQLNDSIKKMDSDPAVKFQKAMQDLQVALKPVLSVVADVITKFAEWISNNPKLAATLAAVAVAIGVISGAILALAPIVSVIMSIVGVVASALGVATAVAAGIVAIIPIIIAAIVALGVVIYQNWESIKQWTIDTFNFIGEYLSELWSGIVETSSVWLSSLVESVSSWWSSLVDSTTTWLSSMVETASTYWSSLVETASSWLSSLVETAVGWLSSLVETASSWWSTLVETASQFFMQLFQKWQEIWNSILTFLDPIISAISVVLEAGWLLIQAGAQIAWALISQYIIQPIQEAYNWVSAKIGELVTWLGTQWEIAKAMAQIAWGLFKQYIIQPVQEAWTIVKQKFSDLVSWLSSQWELAKSYTLMAWNLVKQYVIQPVQELWNTTKQKLADLANWILSNWESIKSYTLTAWNLVKQYVIQPVTDAYNQAKQKFTDLYNSAREKFDSVKSAAQEKFEAAKRFIIDPIRDAVGKVEEFIGKIKGFFTNLKLKIPKPEMPPLPHFSLQTSTKNVLGKDISYPSGINIDWRAKGGIFTKPTIFGMMGGNLQGAGEAGPEAVLPLNKKTLGAIGAGIAAAMPQEQSFIMPGNINQLMIDMTRMMANSMSQLSGLKNVMSGVYGNMSNSRQAMTNGIVNQVFNYSSGQSGNGMIPTQGGDLIIEVPVVLEGRDVARGTYRYTKEYQEREEKRNSAF